MGNSREDRRQKQIKDLTEIKEALTAMIDVTDKAIEEAQQAEVFDFKTEMDIMIRFGVATEALSRMFDK